LAYSNEKEYDQAIADYYMAIKIDPKFTNTCLGRGLIYETRCDHDRAIVDFNKAIEINPNHAAAYNYRGTVRYREKEYDQAIADYNRVIAINPKDSPTYKNLGRGVLTHRATCCAGRGDARSAAARARYYSTRAGPAWTSGSSRFRVSPSRATPTVSGRRTNTLALVGWLCSSPTCHALRLRKFHVTPTACVVFHRNPHERCKMAYR
jgi:tetratricopeptide (TPR) repeat protein